MAPSGVGWAVTTGETTSSFSSMICPCRDGISTTFVSSLSVSLALWRISFYLFINVSILCRGGTRYFYHLNGLLILKSVVQVIHENCSNFNQKYCLWYKGSYKRRTLCYTYCLRIGLGCLMPLLSIFQLYPGGQFLLVEETGVPGENPWPATSHWQTLLHNVVSCTPSGWGDAGCFCLNSL